MAYSIESYSLKVEHSETDLTPEVGHIKSKVLHGSLRYAHFPMGSQG